MTVGFSPALLLALAAVFVVGSLLLMRALEQQEKVKARLVRAANPNLPAVIDAPVSNDGRTVAVDAVAKLGSALARSGLLPAATAALDELVWWAKATMAARAASA